MVSTSTIVAQSPELLATSVNQLYSDVSTSSTLVTTSLTTVYGSAIQNDGNNPIYINWGLSGSPAASTLTYKLNPGEFFSQSPYSWNRYAAICASGQSSTIVVVFNGIA